MRACRGCVEGEVGEVHRGGKEAALKEVADAG